MTILTHWRGLSCCLRAQLCFSSSRLTGQDYFQPLVLIVFVTTTSSSSTSTSTSTSTSSSSSSFRLIGGWQTVGLVSGSQPVLLQPVQCTRSSLKFGSVYKLQLLQLLWFRHLNCLVIFKKKKNIWVWAKIATLLQQLQLQTYHITYISRCNYLMSWTCHGCA